MSTDWPVFWLTVAQTVFVVISLLLVVWQIRQANKEAKSDHSRRQEEALIGYFTDSFPQFYAGMHSLENTFGKNATSHPMTPEQIQKIDDSAELQLELLHMLGFLETFSTGVNEGVFEYRLADKLIGGGIIDAWKFVKPYVMHVRQNRGNARFYDQMEIFANQLIANGKTSDGLITG